MDGLGPATAFTRAVAAALQDAHFTLLDIGCSGGINPVWQVFGDRLTAFGFDPNLAEIERLSRQHAIPGATYVPCFVGLPPDDPGIERLRTGIFWARSPWDRLSVVRTLQIRAPAIAVADSDEKTRLNQWGEVQLADPEKPVVITDFLRQRGVSDIDFVKIDIDGADFLILRSLVPLLDEAKVLGVGIEVNFFGSGDPEIHTFHNVDRLMKQAGFELFALSTRPYSMAALPSPYRVDAPALTVSGRPLQGDAIYLRDAAASEHAAWARSAGPHKLAKLAGLFSLCGLPDCAAELLVCYRENLQPLLDVASALDLLTEQTTPPGQPVRTYKDYMAAFEADAPEFYAAKSQTDAPAQPAPAEVADEAITGLQRALEQEQAERRAAESVAQEARLEATQMRADIAALRNSTSWRLTAPLRTTVDLLRRRRGLAT